MPSGTTVYETVKAATVAIVAAYPQGFPHRPFSILGSGFCIHSEGIVVTCNHVFQAFVSQESQQRLQAEGATEGRRVPVRMTAPYAMFLGGVHGAEIHMHPVGVTNAVSVKDTDLAALRLSKHPAFGAGFPTLPVADFSELHEMMDVATCGFPLGEVLQVQMGTITSSFTKGMISSICPAAGIAKERVTGFQLDLTATNGNSGGPVFCLNSGRVFGVLQGGAVHPETGHVVQGLTRAEPIYPLSDSDLIERLLRM